jgi:hypothetical protein
VSGSTPATPEHTITDAIIRDCAGDTACLLGYRGAATIRSLRFGEAPGTVDLVIPPQPETGQRLVLVRAARHDVPEAVDRVLGELVRFYALGRALTEEQLRALTAFALSSPARELAYYGVGYRLAFGPGQAWPAAAAALAAEQVDLILALDGRPSNTLKATVARLQEHGLNLRLVAVIDSRIHLEEDW